jgi:hypothetical protein
MIRFILGLIVVMGAMGGLENDPEAPILVLLAIAGIGLTLMYFGTKKLR